MNAQAHRKHRVTWEAALWIVIGLTALVMRVSRLGAAPLDTEEAQGAMMAWRAVSGQGLPLVDYNPFLLAGNGLLFMLFGASDALARLWPALFGTLLALAPVLFRRPLGRVGALAAGAYLAISPTGLVAARQLEGTSVAAAGAMISLGGLLHFFDSGRRRWLTVAGASLGLAVASGAAVYGLLVPLGVAWLVMSRLRSEGDTVLVHGHLRELRLHAGHLALSFVAGVLACATGMGWNLSGVGAVGDHLAGWIGRFGSESAASASPLLLLGAYELLATAVGLGGVVWGVLEDRVPALLLGTWAGLGVLTLALMPGRAPTDLLWVVVPMALLTGMGVEAMAGGRWDSGGALRLAYAGIVLVLWSHVYLMLARYAAYGDRADLALASIGVVLQGLLALSFVLVLGTDATLRTSGAATTVALLGFTLAAAWGAAYGHPGDPREALRGRSTATSLADLVETLEDLSWRETGMPTSLAFTFEAPEDSVVAWYLRDFDEARRVDWLGDLTADEVEQVVVTLGQDNEPPTGGDGEYAGQDFPLSRGWAPRELTCRLRPLDCREGVSWFLLRDRVPRAETDRWVTLWGAGDFAYSD